MTTIARDGVDITRLVRLHRRYHGLPMACLVRRHREETAQRQASGLKEAAEQHGREAEPQRNPGQRGWVLAQTGDAPTLARVEAGS